MMEFFEPTTSWMVALGKTLIHSIWIGLLLLALLKIALQTLPARYSLIRYRIAAASLLLFLGMVATAFLIIYAPAQGTVNAAQTDSGTLALIPFLQGVITTPDSSNFMLFCTACSYLYFIGIAVMMVRFVFSVHHIRQLKRNGMPVPDEWYDRLLQIKQRLGIRKNIALMESDRLGTPAVIGLLKPVIMVPVGMFTHLSVDQVETIFMHELHHLRRLDFLVNLIQLVVEGLFFYHPAVWMISRMIRTEREICCDDHVIRSCGDPNLYARALFQLAKYQPLVSQLVPGAGGSDHHQLFQRIKRILNQHTMKTNIREKLYAFLILTVGVILLLTVSGFNQGYSMMKPADSEMEMQALFGPSALDPEPSSKPVSIADSEPISEPVSSVIQDTIPEPEPVETIDMEELESEMEAAKLEALESIDWEELQQELEAVKLEALESIDWEELQEEMEAAKLEALESIDWEELQQEMEAAKLEAWEAMDSIDWQQFQQEWAHMQIHLDSCFHDFDFDFDFDFDMDFDMDFDLENLKIEMHDAFKEMEEMDWEEIRENIEESMKEIDWESIKEEVEQSMKEVDWESIKEEIEQSMKDVDWEAIKKEMEHLKIHVDSTSHEMHVQ